MMGWKESREDGGIRKERGRMGWLLVDDGGTVVGRAEMRNLKMPKEDLKCDLFTVILRNVTAQTFTTADRLMSNTAVTNQLIDHRMGK